MSRDHVQLFQHCILQKHSQKIHPGSFTQTIQVCRPQTSLPECTAVDTLANEGVNLAMRLSGKRVKGYCSIRADPF